MTSTDYQLYELGDFTLENGAVLPDARLGFKTFGTLSPQRDNVVVIPGAFNGAVEEYDGWMAPGMAIDPERYFVVVVGLFGNGQSSSPSNTPAPFDGPRFPMVTVADNVNAQYQMLTKGFGVTGIELVAGFSMGALQTFHWGAHHPELVRRIAPFCGAARCSRHNYVFLASLKAAIETDQTFNGGDYEVLPRAGLSTFGRIYAGWAFSQAFYREKVDMDVMGFASVDDFLARYWDTLFSERDANDLLLMVWTWQHADIAAGARYGGDLPKALAGITARATVMPSETDLYFPVADNVLEVAAMPNARCVPIPSIWGHVAGACGANPADTAFIDGQFRELLAS